MKTVNLVNRCNIKVLNSYKAILNTDFIFIPIKDESKIVVKKGDKICQGIFINFLTVDNEDEINNKRISGFGSTDKKESD